MCVGFNPEEAADLYLIDFGIAKYFRDGLGVHIPKAVAKKFCGTAEFTSLAAHNGSGQSRRDDLESIGLMLVFFLKGGTLPWYNKFKVEDKNKPIRKSMTTTSISELC